MFHYLAIVVLYSLTIPNINASDHMAGRKRQADSSGEPTPKQSPKKDNSDDEDDYELIRATMRQQMPLQKIDFSQSMDHHPAMGKNIASLLTIRNQHRRGDTTHPDMTMRITSLGSGLSRMFSSDTDGETSPVSFLESSTSSSPRTPSSRTTTTSVSTPEAPRITPIKTVTPLHTTTSQFQPVSMNE